MKRMILVGLAAGLALLAFYFGVLTVSQGVKHAVEQSAKLWYWLLALAGGFGVQAHHLSDVLPLLGLSGLAAFLVNYQLFFIVAGVMANAIGITIMLETIQRHGLCPVLARWQVNMGWVKKGTMISAGVVTLIAFFVTIQA